MTTTQQYGFWGVLFGCCFPAMAWFIDGYFIQEIVFTGSFLSQIHTKNPIHYIIDLAPLVLGLAFAYMGSIARKLQNLSISLEKTVQDRTQSLSESEKKLKSKQESLLKLIDDTGFVILKTLPKEQNRIIEVSESVLELTGYSAQDFLKGKKHLRDIILAEDLKLLGQSYQNAISNKKPIDIYFRIKTKDEELRWLNNKTKLVYDGQNQLELLETLLIDVTRAKRQEQDLKKLSLVAQSTLNTVIITDPKGITLWVNNGFERFTGYTAEDIIGKKPGEVLQGPGTDPKTTATMREYLTHNLPIKVEILNYTKQKKPYWTELDITPVFDDQGEVEFFMSLQIDVSEHKAMTQEIREQHAALLASEEELKQNLEEMQATQDQLSVAHLHLQARINATDATAGYMELSTQRKIQSINAKMASWLGYTEKELVLKEHKLLLWHETKPEDYESFWTRLLAGEIISQEYARKHKNGSLVWLYASYCPMKDKEGKVVGIMKLAINLTSSKQKEVEIQQQNVRLLKMQQEERDANEIFKALFEYSSNVHLLFDDTGITNCNNAAVSLLGYESKSALLKVHPAVLSPEVQPDGRTSLEKSIEMDGLARQNGFHRFEWLHRKADGADFWVEVTLTPIKIKEKDTLLVVWHDLTDIKKNETEIIAARQTAEESLKHLTEAQEHLIQSEKMATLGQLVASIAHEINTPLGAIRSSSGNSANSIVQIIHQLPDFLHNLNPTDLQVFTNLVEKASTKTAALSTRDQRKQKQLLREEMEQKHVSKADELAELIVEMGLHEDLHDFKAALNQTNISTIFQNAHLLTSLMKSNQIVRVAADKVSKIVFALKNFSRQDNSGLKQLVNINLSIETTLTLYHNQIKDSVETVKWLAELPEIEGYPDELAQVWTNLIHNAIQAMNYKGQLTVKTSVQASLIRVSIADTGPGIPTDIQDKIFNPFFTTKKAGEGSGLGLDIVKKIVEKHQGKIYFDTKLGEGTTFYVDLPLHSENS